MLYKQVFLKITANESSGLFILFLIWAVIQISAYLAFGVRAPIDTELYLNNADLLLEGQWPQGQEFFYLSYVAILALLKLVTLDPGKIIILQILISGTALYCIYKLTQGISRNNNTAFIAALFFALWFKFQQWNLILYTDALFANSVVVVVYLIYVAKSKQHYILLTPAIVFIVLLRPTGVVFLIALLSYFTFSRLDFRKLVSPLNALYLLFFVVTCTILANLFLIDFVDSFLQSYVRAEIIYPNITLGVERPANLVTLVDQGQPLTRLTNFILHNPFYMIKISFFKMILFLGHIKPYYSLLHNLIIVGFLYPIYFFAIKGYVIMPKNSLKVFVLTLISLQVVMVGLTSENWDGRFILTILPWVFMISSLGITSTFLLKFTDGINQGKGEVYSG